MEMNDNDIRVKWIDSAKFIGIFAIYLALRAHLWIKSQSSAR